MQLKQFHEKNTVTIQAHVGTVATFSASKIDY